MERGRGARIPRFRDSDFELYVKSERLSETPAVQQGREGMQEAVLALTDPNSLDFFTPEGDILVPHTRES